MRYVATLQQYSALIFYVKTTNGQLFATQEYAEICRRKPMEIRGLKTTIPAVENLCKT